MHLICNWKAVRCLQLETFNLDRLQLCVDGFLRGRMPTVLEANQLEPILGHPLSPIRMGVKISPSIDGRLLSSLLVQYRNKSFVIDAHHKSIYIKQGASDRDSLQAAFEALVAISRHSPMQERGDKLDLLFEEFLQISARSGFDTSRHHLGVDEWRLSSTS